MFKSIFKLTSVAAVTSICSYLSNLLLANYLGPTYYGKYNFILTVAAYIMVISNFGTIENAPTLFKKYGETFFYNLTAFKIINLVLCIFAIILIDQFTEISYLLTIGFVSLGGLYAISGYELRVKNLKFNYIQLLERIFLLLAVLTFIFINPENNFIYICIVISIIPVLSILFQIKDLNLSILPNSKSMILTIYYKSWQIFVYGLSKTMFGNLIRLVIFWNFGALQLGLFAAAWQVVPPASLYYTQVTRIFRLKLTEVYDERSHNSFIRLSAIYFLYLMVPAIFAGLMMYRFGDHIILLLFNEEFEEAVLFIPLISFYFAVIALEVFVSVIAVIKSKSNYLLISYLSSSVVLITVYYFYAATTTVRELLLIMIIMQLLASLIVLISLFLEPKKLTPKF